MAGLSIVNVRKSFGSVEVIHGVSVDVKDGEFVALVGPSGCGKSTLLRMIAGLEDISDGDIVIGGEVVNGLRPKERDIAMVFQSYALYPHMNVRKNLSFSLRLKGEDKQTIERKVLEAARILGLEPYLDRLPRQLSGGQRQRVAMGRAIVRNPQVFLFDEPLSNLDAQLRVQMRTEIKDLHQRLGTTTVYVTHDQIEAMTMADKIVVLRDGRIEQIGSPIQLYDMPDNLFVARFIGSPSMNLFEAVVNSDGRSLDSAIGVTVPLHEPMDQHAGRTVQCGVRPEHAGIVAGGDTGRIVTVEPTGSETQVVVNCNGVNLTALLRERTNLRAGDGVGITIAPGGAHVFASDTGQRLRNQRLAA